MATRPPRSGLSDEDRRCRSAENSGRIIGVNWEHKFGETADIARDHGGDASDVSFVTGVRFWF
jgi:uncharacterized protein involved in copper resistance